MPWFLSVLPYFLSVSATAQDPPLHFKLHQVTWIYEIDESEEEEIVQTNSIPISYSIDGQILGSSSSLMNLLVSNHVYPLLFGLVHCNFFVQDFFLVPKNSLTSSYSNLLNGVIH